LAIKHW